MINVGVYFASRKRAKNEKMTSKPRSVHTRTKAGVEHVSRFAPEELGGVSTIETLGAVARIRALGDARKERESVEGAGGEDAGGTGSVCSLGTCGENTVGVDMGSQSNGEGAASMDSGASSEGSVGSGVNREGTDRGGSAARGKDARCAGTVSEKPRVPPSS